MWSKKAFSRTTVLSILLYVATTSLVHGQTTCVAGQWSTSFGTMNISYSDTTRTTVVGKYSDDSGRIDGKVANNVLDGYWIEASSGQRCPTLRDGSYYWGKINYKFNKTAFNGTWSYCSNPTSTSSGWFGTRIGGSNFPKNGVYWSARDLSGLPNGNHHFILLATTNKYRRFKGVAPIAEGNGCGTNYFFTVGGFGNESEKLVARINEDSDVRAVREYLDPTQYTDGWDLEIHYVAPPTRMTSRTFYNRVMKLATKYKRRRTSTLPYNKWGDNGAAWVNTLLYVSGISNSAREILGQFNGIDFGKNVLVPSYLFKYLFQ